jgi:hypothetical protein
MPRLLLLLTCLLCASVAAQTKVYRYVDENGNVVYSTEPQEGAETIEVPEPNIAQPPPEMPRIQSESEEQSKAGRPPYRRFEISSPGEDEVVWNTGTRELEVSLSLEPALQSVHRIEVSVDGKNARGTSTLYLLTDINRGTHEITARIIDDNGNVVQEADPHIVHVRQHAIGSAP